MQFVNKTKPLQKLIDLFVKSEFRFRNSRENIRLQWSSETGNGIWDVAKGEETTMLLLNWKINPALKGFDFWHINNSFVRNRFSIIYFCTCSAGTDHAVLLTCYLDLALCT